MPGRSSVVLSCWYWVVSFCIPRRAWFEVRGGRSRAACSGVMPVNMWLMVTHLGLSVLAFNWAGTLIQHKLLWAFQFPQIKASAESFFQSAGRFSSTTICDVLFVYPSDSIFCVLLDCCEEKSQMDGGCGAALYVSTLPAGLGLTAREWGATCSCWTVYIFEPLQYVWDVRALGCAEQCFAASGSSLHQFSAWIWCWLI